MNYYRDNSLFNRSFGLIDEKNSYIKVDIYQKGEMNYIDMDLPGFDKENINIDYNNGYLAVSAYKENSSGEETSYIRQERYFGEYSRSFYIGDISQEGIKASYENGILKINYSNEEKNNNRKINID